MDIRPQDLKLPGTEYHTSLGAVRTKPGRGDPTRSLSCSDKMLKWRALGMQVPSHKYVKVILLYLTCVLLFCRVPCSDHSSRNPSLTRR